MIWSVPQRLGAGTWVGIERGVTIAPNFRTPVPGLATDSFLANSPWVSHVEFQTLRVSSMTTSKPYDNRNRPTRMASTPWASPAISLQGACNAKGSHQGTKRSALTQLHAAGGRISK